MPTPNHPALPLCSKLAAEPDRTAFAVSLSLFMTSRGEFQRIYHHNLNGVLYAYRELGVIKYNQLDTLLNELDAFAYGATA
jgi:hypothetical protein